MKWIALELLIGTSIEVNGLHPNLKTKIIYKNNMKVSEIIGEKNFYIKKDSIQTGCEFEHFDNGRLVNPVTEYYAGSCRSFIEQINGLTTCSN